MPKKDAMLSLAKEEGEEFQEGRVERWEGHWGAGCRRGGGVIQNS